MGVCGWVVDAIKAFKSRSKFRMNERVEMEIVPNARRVLQGELGNRVFFGCFPVVRRVAWNQSREFLENGGKWPLCCRFPASPDHVAIPVVFVENVLSVSQKVAEQEVKYGGGVQRQVVKSGNVLCVCIVN
jgi:hypothetical protein